MGQKVRPTGFRVGVMETWRSRWYAPKREFGDLLLEDFKIRKFVNTKYEFAEIAKLEIERKTQIALRLDADVLAWYRGLGAGWQTRMNAVLKAYRDATI